MTTKDAGLAKKARMIANHGRIAKYNHEFEGRNSRLDGLQAAILSAKLRHLDQWTERRIAIADRYIDRLSEVPDLVTPVRMNCIICLWCARSGVTNSLTSCVSAISRPAFTTPSRCLGWRPMQNTRNRRRTSQLLVSPTTF